MPEFVTTREAAAFLRMNPQAFCRWARLHGVPRLGRTHCRWRIADIRRAADEVLDRDRPKAPRVRRVRARGGEAERLRNIRESIGKR